MLAALQDLRQQVETDGQARFEQWRSQIQRPEFLTSAHNLAQYLALPEILDLLTVNMPVYIDDGKIRTRVIDVDYALPNGQTGILLQVTHVSPKGIKLKKTPQLRALHSW